MLPPPILLTEANPTHPHELAEHSCINLRTTSGKIYAWEFEKDGREINVKVQGQLVLDSMDLLVNPAVSGHGLVHLIEDRVAPSLADGTLVHVLEDWCEPFDGYYLYYPSRRQQSAAFRLFLEALRYRN